jgi:putative nucleotidyltransferase with HDIG domain
MRRKSYLTQRIVPSGAHAVGRNKNQILVAYLGTCVGITLFDRQAKVGGLAHFLLPEPTGVDKTWQPENYASTGLPLFIQALCDEGADKANLEACVAGGALVGPVCERDLNLDIGGRTTEVVESILHMQGIPVRESETGGHFTCQLTLNLKTSKSQILPVGNQPASPKKDFKKPTSKQLDRAIQRLRPIPQVALKIIRMIHERRHSMEQVGKEIRQDQVFSANVIRLCNSALIGMTTKVDSVDRALVVLGEKQLLQLAVSASVESFFPETEQGYSLCKGGLYQHALGTAMITERLANFTGRVPGDVAYTAGLLHDIGKVILDQYLSPAHPLFYRRTQVDGASLILVEDEVLGISHPKAGGRMADHWSLPENLIDTIRHHHHPEQATVDPTLTHLVYLADLLMSRFLVGQELEHLNTDKLSERLRKVGLSLSQLPVIVDLIPPKIF